MKKSQTLSRGRLVALAAATALVIAGCGGSDSEGGDKDGESDVDSSALGTANKASGDPVLVYFIGEGKTEVLDNTDETNGAKAAAEYANNYLGGLNGRPIEVKACSTKGTPAGTTDCANQAVSDKAIAVINGAAGAIDAQIDPLTKAKIPLIAANAATPKATTTPGVFALSNALGYFGGPAAFAGKEGFKSATILAIDVPGALEPAQQVGGLTFGNNGIKVEVVGIPKGTADMTPQLTAANKSKPEMYHIIGDASFCTSALKAVKTVAPDAAITVIDRCIADASAIPGGYEGVNVVTSFDPGTTSEDGKLFAAALDKYGDGSKAGPTAAFGYAGMLGFIRAANAAKITDYTGPGVTSAMKNAPAVDLPLGNGSTFQCNGKQVAIAPNVCATDSLIGVADADGKVEFEPVDAGDTYNPPAA